jgi:hypothetical protein
LIKNSPKEFKPQTSDIDLRHSIVSAEKLKKINVEDSEERNLNWKKIKKVK